jgi:zinc protease
MVRPHLAGERIVMRLVLLLAWLSVCQSSLAATMAEHAQRGKVAGIDLVTYHSTVKDVVVIEAALPGGDAMAGSGNIATPTLSGMMLDRGTKSLDKFAIAEKLNNLGAQVSFSVGPQALEVRGKCLRKDLSTVIDLIAAELRTPALKEEEFAKAKQEFVGGVQASSQDTGARAREAFDRGIYPDGHPNYPHTWEQFVAAGKSATLAEVKAFQARYYGPSHMILVLAGDVDDKEARRIVGKAFAGWSGGGEYLLPAHPAGANGPKTLTVTLAQKPSVSVMLGQATGLRYRDADALALRVATAILGRGFTGRLMHEVREKQGLTYGIGASVGDDAISDGSWEISATFAPTLLEKGLSATRGELSRWWSEGVAQEELDGHREGLLGTYVVGLSTTGGIANQLLINLQRGFDVTWLDEYPKALRTLTLAQVNAAIKAHLDPKAMVLVEAGSVAAPAK